MTRCFTICTHYLVYFWHYIKRNEMGGRSIMHGN